MYHGGGGFIHSEIYNMPIWMRLFHIQKISDFNTKQQKKMEESKGQSNIGDDKISRPDINPSSTYNINK